MTEKKWPVVNELDDYSTPMTFVCPRCHEESSQPDGIVHSEKCKHVDKTKGCTKECFDDGEQVTEQLCNYCQSYVDSVRGEARRDMINETPEYLAWKRKREYERG